MTDLQSANMQVGEGSKGESIKISCMYVCTFKAVTLETLRLKQDENFWLQTLHLKS